MKDQMRALLKTFKERKIPSEYKIFDVSSAAEADSAKFDLMYCYEELFDYSWRVLHHHAVDAKSNFAGAEPTALSDEFIDYLMKLRQSTPSLHEFIGLLLEVINALRTYLSCMRLPRHLKSYAENIAMKDDRISCDIAVNHCKDLCFGLHGNLIHKVLSHGLINPIAERLSISLMTDDQNSHTLYDSRRDGYGSQIEPEQQCKPIEMKKAVCPKCGKSQFQVHFVFEYPDDEDDIPALDLAFTWVWITMKCSNCRRKYSYNCETD